MLGFRKKEEEHVQKFFRILIRSSMVLTTLILKILRVARPASLKAWFAEVYNPPQIGNE